MAEIIVVIAVRSIELNNNQSPGIASALIAGKNTDRTLAVIIPGGADNGVIAIDRNGGRKSIVFSQILTCKLVLNAITFVCRKNDQE